MGETRHRNITLYRRGDDRDCLSVAVRKRFHFAAYIIGALVAVWHAVSLRGQRLQFKDGAKLGFFSTLFGVLVAIVIGDLIWLFSIINSGSDKMRSYSWRFLVRFSAQSRSTQRAHGATSGKTLSMVPLPYPVGGERDLLRNLWDPFRAAGSKGFSAARSSLGICWTEESAGVCSAEGNYPVVPGSLETGGERLFLAAGNSPKLAPNFLLRRA